MGSAPLLAPTGSALRLGLLGPPGEQPLTRDVLADRPLVHPHRDEVITLARQQEASHRQRLAEYQAIVAQISDAPSVAPALATLRMGILYETMSIEYWDDIARNPPGGAPTSSGG